MPIQRDTPITPSQIRAGRAVLNWSQEELARQAGVGLSTLRDYENERRSGEVGATKAIVTTLEKNGIAFLPSDGEFGPGVRVASKLPNVLRRPKSAGRFDGLLISVEWRGKEFDLCIPQNILDDLGGFSKTQVDAQYFALFEKHRTKLLKAAAKAIDDGRAMPDRRVHLVSQDVFS